MHTLYKGDGMRTLHKGDGMHTLYKGDGMLKQAEGHDRRSDDKHSVYKFGICLLVPMMEACYCR